MIKFLTGDDVFRRTGGDSDSHGKPVATLIDGIRTPRREMINAEEPPDVFRPLPSRRLRCFTRQGRSLGDQTGRLNSSPRGTGRQPPPAGWPAPNTRRQKRKLSHATQICQEAASLLVCQPTGPYSKGTHQADRPLY